MPAALASDTRFRPFEAMRAVKTLLATGDTRQVFVILRAMRGRSFVRNFRRFAESKLGTAVLKERRDLLTTLTDRPGLARMPQGSLGRTYLDFMEAENLSAKELVMVSQWESEPAPPEIELFRSRMREMHDLTHTVTGYGREPLGELCLLTFMYRQQRNLGMLLIVIMAWNRLPKMGHKAVREAWRNGKKARWLPEQDWEALLARPLDMVRRDLSVPTPLVYQSITP